MHLAPCLLLFLVTLMSYLQPPASWPGEACAHVLLDLDQIFTTLEDISGVVIHIIEQPKNVTTNQPIIKPDTHLLELITITNSSTEATQRLGKCISDVATAVSTPRPISSLPAAMHAHFLPVTFKALKDAWAMPSQTLDSVEDLRRNIQSLALGLRARFTKQTPSASHLFTRQEQTLSHLFCSGYQQILLIPFCLPLPALNGHLCDRQCSSGHSSDNPAAEHFFRNLDASFEVELKLDELNSSRFFDLPPSFLDLPQGEVTGLIETECLIQS